MTQKYLHVCAVYNNKFSCYASKRFSSTPQQGQYTVLAQQLPGHIKLKCSIVLSGDLEPIKCYSTESAHPCARYNINTTVDTIQYPIYVQVWSDTEFEVFNDGKVINICLQMQQVQIFAKNLFQMCCNIIMSCRSTINILWNTLTLEKTIYI